MRFWVLDGRDGFGQLRSGQFEWGWAGRVRSGGNGQNTGGTKGQQASHREVRFWVLDGPDGQLWSGQFEWGWAARVRSGGNGQGTGGTKGQRASHKEVRFGVLEGLVGPGQVGSVGSGGDGQLGSGWVWLANKQEGLWVNGHQTKR